MVKGLEYEFGALSVGGDGAGAWTTSGSEWRILTWSGESIGAGQWRDEAGVRMGRNSVPEGWPVPLDESVCGLRRESAEKSRLESSEG